MDNAPWEIWREYDDCYVRDSDTAYKTLDRARDLAEVKSFVHSGAILIVSVDRPWKVTARYVGGVRVEYDADIHA